MFTIAIKYNYDECEIYWNLVHDTKDHGTKKFSLKPFESRVICIGEVIADRTLAGTIVAEMVRHFLACAGAYLQLPLANEEGNYANS